MLGNNLNAHFGGLDWDRVVPADLMQPAISPTDEVRAFILGGLAVLADDARIASEFRDDERVVHQEPERFTFLDGLPIARLDARIEHMTPEVCGAFARYNRWMNAKVYAASARLSDEDRKRDRGAFFRSIHGVMNHILVADRIWLGRIAGRVPEPGFIGVDGIKTLDQEIASDFDELRHQRGETDAAIDAWVATLTAESLAATFRMIRKGEAREFPLWWAVAQLFNHQTHHRGQITTLLVQAGQDPGATDLFAMLNEEAQSPT